MYDCFALWHRTVQEMILLEITYKTFTVRNRFAILWHFVLVDYSWNSVRTLTFKMVYQCLIKVKVFLVYFANNLNNAFAFCTLSFANISALETTTLTYSIHKSNGNYMWLLLSLFYYVMFIYFKRNRLDCKRTTINIHSIKCTFPYIEYAYCEHSFKTKQNAAMSSIISFVFNMIMVTGLDFLKTVLWD